MPCNLGCAAFCFQQIPRRCRERRNVGPGGYREGFDARGAAAVLQEPRAARRFRRDPALRSGNATPRYRSESPGRQERVKERRTLRTPGTSMPVSTKLTAIWLCFRRRP